MRPFLIRAKARSAFTSSATRPWACGFNQLGSTTRQRTYSTRPKPATHTPIQFQMKRSPRQTQGCAQMSSRTNRFIKATCANTAHVVHTHPQTYFLFIARAKQAGAFVQPTRHIQEWPANAPRATACAQHPFRKPCQRATSNTRHAI